MIYNSFRGIFLPLHEDQFPTKKVLPIDSYGEMRGGVDVTVYVRRRGGRQDDQSSEPEVEGIGVTTNTPSCSEVDQIVAFLQRP